jgi:hypothetical protein
MDSKRKSWGPGRNRKVWLVLTRWPLHADTDTSKPGRRRATQAIEGRSPLWLAGTWPRIPVKQGKRHHDADVHRQDREGVADKAAQNENMGFACRRSVVAQSQRNDKRRMWLVDNPGRCEPLTATEFSSRRQGLLNLNHHLAGFPTVPPNNS